MTKVVLDASAVLASIRGEPGGAEIDEIEEFAAISAVNLAEVVGKLIDKGSGVERAVAIARGLQCRVVDLDEESAITTGALRHETARYGLSLADRACLALARAEGCPALTTD